jgi:phosphoribosylaminoimidazolecarboxamide formyltransferase/IMP cyclohydrolase
MQKIESALISVYNKEGLENIVKKLVDNNVVIYSTGGTYKFIKDLGHPVTSIESITEFPEILDGRVKSLHPKIFGGILNRRDSKKDQKEIKKLSIPKIDLVIVDLYPFEETIENEESSHDDIIEKIDIGGVSLIRAAAKNYKDVLIISSVSTIVKPALVSKFLVRSFINIPVCNVILYHKNHLFTSLNFICKKYVAQCCIVALDPKLD